MSKRFNRWVVLYVCLSRFDLDLLYEATDVAEWLGIPEKHRLVRYYLNRLMREGHLVRVDWGHRMFFGRRELLDVLKSLDDIFEPISGGWFRIKK